MSAFIRECKILPPEWQGFALDCINFGYECGVDVQGMEKDKRTRQAILCAVGLFLLLFGVALTFLNKEMTRQQNMSCCTLISLGVAGFLVFLPGFLTLQGVMKPNPALESAKFQATGATAIFILVFCVLHYTL